MGIMERKSVGHPRSGNGDARIRFWRLGFQAWISGCFFRPITDGRMASPGLQWRAGVQGCCGALH